MRKVIQIVSIQRHQRSKVIRLSKQRRLEICRTIRVPSFSDIDGSGAEQVPGIHFGDGGCEIGLNSGQTLEIGKRTCLVGHGVALEDLGRVDM